MRVRLVRHSDPERLQGTAEVAGRRGSLGKSSRGVNYQAVQGRGGTLDPRVATGHPVC